jgi:hypothetical protein
MNKFVVIASIFLLAACSQNPQPLSANQQAKQRAGQAGSPSVNAIIDAQTSTRGYGINEVGINSIKTADNTYQIDSTAPQGTVLATAHDMFQKRAYQVCGGDNYTYSITTQENVSFYEFVGRDKKLVNMPNVKGTVYCNTRGQGQQAAVNTQPAF